MCASSSSSRSVPLSPRAGPGKCIEVPSAADPVGARTDSLKMIYLLLQSPNLHFKPSNHPSSQPFTHQPGATCSCDQRTHGHSMYVTRKPNIVLLYAMHRDSPARTHTRAQLSLSLSHTHTHTHTHTHAPVDPEDDKAVESLKAEASMLVRYSHKQKKIGPADCLCL